MASQKIYQNLPQSPGVYLFKDKKQKVIYIGKAINLRNRVKNHFTDKNDDLRHKNLISLVEKIDFQTVSWEFEALLLEARLIKQYKPKFNILLKDDTRYLYVGITKDKFPQIKLVRQPEKDENLSDWFGPFPSSYGLKEVLRFVRRIFPYRSCENLPKKPCLYSHLKLCSAPCINQVESYPQTIRKIKMLLNGEVKPLISLLTKQMNLSSQKQKFEEAQGYKKQIEMIQNLLTKRPKSAEEERFVKQLEQLKNILIRYQNFDPFIIHRLEAYDISNLGKEIIVGSMVAFIDGEPDTSQYRKFRISNQFQDDFGAIKQVILRRLGHQEWVYPQVILVDGGKGQISAAFEAIKEKNLAGKVGLLGLTKELETIVIPEIKIDKITGWKKLNLSINSPALQLLQHSRDEAHRFAQRYYKILALPPELKSNQKRKNF
ncbi:MAG: UvrABC system protein C [Microgenomates group bacterium ADurb.Bin219]|nr:MAG: UvrABC system protein C [Microgenomates group bacterium ADurb.Bin219]HNP89006.1 GIY-YIG nuclease family protein [Candidatus Woesebacteria bacterium]